MVRPFQFARIPNIYFKNGKLSELPGIIKMYGTNIILVTGKSSFIQSLQAENLLNSFKKSGINYHHVIVTGEPSPELIDQSVLKLDNESVQMVVSIG